MKTLTNLIIIAFLIVTLAPAAYADRSEKAKVIKFDTIYHDLIVERQDGSKWLIQHNRVCQTMSVDFPVTLILSGDEIVQLKVAVNEICKVYNAVPYSGEAKITELIKSENLILPDHEAKMTWFGNEYLIDYDNRGCRYLKDFLGKRVYLYLPGHELIGSYLILPNNRGQCRINHAKMIGKDQSLSEETINPLEDVDSQAQNNQIYFYWNRHEQASRDTLYLISYSRNRINPEDYNYWEMPNLKRTRRNSYTVLHLENGKDYYFYFTILNFKEKVTAPWKELIVAPISTGGFVNNPDPDTFEIEMEETDDAFRLYWPDRESARLYRVRFYVNGRTKSFQINRPGENEILIPKKEEYIGKRLRLIVRSIPEVPRGRHYRDGIYWTYEEDE